MKRAVFGGICAVGLIGSFTMMARADTTLPSPDQLVTMDLGDRLALYKSMDDLPPSARERNLELLRREIESLTPEQKQAMKNKFEADYAALPPDEREAVQARLTAERAAGK